jgi:hypothetical protein
VTPLVAADRHDHNGGRGSRSGELGDRDDHPDQDEHDDRDLQPDPRRRHRRKPTASEPRQTKR